MAKLTRQIFACVCALSGAVSQAQTLNLPATLNSGAYLSASTVTNCTGTVSQANCTSVTLANNATVTLGAATQIVLGPGFTAIAGNASTSLTAGIVPLPTVSGLSISPGSVTSGASATLTATLSSNAPYGGVTIALTSSNTAAFNPPATVTVAAGQLTGSASVTAGTVSASTSLTVTASYNNSSQPVPVTVLSPPIVLTSVSVNPLTVISTNSAAVTVTLSGAAPSGGAVVTLGGNNTSAFNPPASITVAAGQTTGTAGVSAGTVSASTNVTVTGTYNGSQTGSVTILPLPTVGALTISPSSLVSNASATITVTLSAAAPSSGAMVSLSGTNASAFNPPDSIVVAGGQTVGSVAITAGMVTVSTNATVTASYNGAGQAGVLTVIPPPDFTITLTANSPPATAMIGGSAAFTVAVSPINGFNGAVTLAALGLPTGASASFSPLTITTSGTSTMTVTAPSGGAGNFTVTVNGVSSSLSHNAVSTLAVQDYTVTLSPYNYASPPTITAGGTQSFTIGAAGVNGFTGNIALTYGQYAPDGGCSLTNLNMPSQVTAGSAVAMTLTPYSANCFFQITANASGDAHVLLGAVFVSSFTDKSVDPHRFVDLAAWGIANVGDDEALKQVAKLVKLDEKRFGILVSVTLIDAKDWHNPFTVGYHGFEMNDPAISQRIEAWVESQLGSSEEYTANDAKRRWAEAMVDKYGGAPAEAQWAGDPFVVRLKPSLAASLHNDMIRMSVDALAKRTRK